MILREISKSLAVVFPGNRENSILDRSPVTLNESLISGGPDLLPGHIMEDDFENIVTIEHGFLSIHQLVLNPIRGIEMFDGSKPDISGSAGREVRLASNSVAPV